MKMICPTANLIILVSDKRSDLHEVFQDLLATFGNEVQLIVNKKRLDCLNVRGANIPEIKSYLKGWSPTDAN